MASAKFWESKTLDQMNCEEWESLCDGCALCCLHKLEDEETQEVFYTQVACQYLDLDTCRCRDYRHRKSLVPSCLSIKEDCADNFQWLPHTCAYRLLAEGKPLLDWHPLVSGSPNTVHVSGASVKDKVLSEIHIHPDDMEAYIIHWVE